MIWRILIILGVLAIITGGAVWFSDGMQVFTKDREEVITIVKDELFGTTHEEKTFVPAFRLGLLPADSTVKDAPASYAFILGISFVIIILSVFNLRRSQSRRKPNT